MTAYKNRIEFCGWSGCYKAAIKFVEFEERVFRDPTLICDKDGSVPVEKRFLCGTHSVEIKETYARVFAYDM